MPTEPTNKTNAELLTQLLAWMDDDGDMADRYCQVNEQGDVIATADGEVEATLAVTFLRSILAELTELTERARRGDALADAGHELLEVMRGNCFDPGYALRKQAAWAALKRTTAAYRS